MPKKSYRIERDVKDELKKQLAAIGAWWFMPVPMGFGRIGVPDFIVCAEGHFFGLEVKLDSPTGTPAQEAQLQKIREAGGIAMIVDKHNVEGMAAMITEMLGLKKR